MVDILQIAQSLGRFLLRFSGVESRFELRGGLVTHRYVANSHGSLPPIVLLHGLGSGATAYGGLMRALRPHVRTIHAPELPGHGFSEASAAPNTPDRLTAYVIETLDGLDGPFWLYGNSLGGALAVRYAVARPARVKGLILSSPAGAPLVGDEMRVLRGKFDIVDRRAARAFLALLVERPGWIIRSFDRSIMKAMRRPAVQGVLESADKGESIDGRALSMQTFPCLLLWGALERLLPDSSFEWYRRHLPQGAVIERPDGFAHSPHLDHPREIAHRVLAFIRACESPRSSNESAA